MKMDGHMIKNDFRSEEGRRQCIEKASASGRLVRQMFARGDEPTPQLFCHFRGHRDKLNAVNFHPFETTVLTAGSDGHIFLWDYANMHKRAIRFDGHFASVNDVTFSTNGDLMLSGSDDRSIGVWVPMVGGMRRYIYGHSASVRSVAFNPIHSDYFLSASNDKTVKLWNLEWSKTKRKTSLSAHDFVASWCLHKSIVKSVRFNSTGTQAITASDDGSVGILDTRISEEALKLEVGNNCPVHAEFNPSSSNYFGVAMMEEFHLYDVRTGKLVQHYSNLHSREITQFCFHPSGDFAITTSEDRSVRILDLVQGRTIFTLFGHNTGSTSVSMSHDGMLLGSGGRDKSLLVWKPIFVPYSHSELEAARNIRKKRVAKVMKPSTGGTEPQAVDQPEVVDLTLSEEDVGQLELAALALSDEDDGQPEVSDLALSEEEDGQSEVSDWALTEGDAGQPEVADLALTEGDVGHPEIVNSVLTEEGPGRPEGVDLNLTREDAGRLEFSPLVLTEEIFRQPEAVKLVMTEEVSVQPKTKLTGILPGTPRPLGCVKYRSALGSLYENKENYDHAAPTFHSVHPPT